MMRMVLVVALGAQSAFALPAQAHQAAETRLLVRPSPAVSATPAPDQQAAMLERFARARDNLVALREGRRAVSDLSPQELQDVLDYERRVRGDYPDTRSARQQCIDDEFRRAGGRPSPLARQVIALKCRD
jgi:hypothetical protein